MRFAHWTGHFWWTTQWIHVRPSDSHPSGSSRDQCGEMVIRGAVDLWGSSAWLRCIEARWLALLSGPAMGISTPLELGPQCPLLGKAGLCCLHTVLRQRRPLTAARSADPIRLRPQCSRSYTVMKPLITEPHCGTPDLEVGKGCSLGWNRAYLCIFWVKTTYGSYG